MTNLAILVYLAEVFDKIDSVSGTAAFLLTFILLMMIFIIFSGELEGVACHCRKYIKLIIKVFIILLVVKIITPSESTIMRMAAFSYGEQFYNSKNVQEIIDPTAKLIKQWIEKQLNDEGKK